MHLQLKTRTKYHRKPKLSKQFSFFPWEWNITYNLHKDKNQTQSKPSLKYESNVFSRHVLFVLIGFCWGGFRNQMFHDLEHVCTTAFTISQQQKLDWSSDNTSCKEQEVEQCALAFGVSGLKGFCAMLHESYTL